MKHATISSHTETEHITCSDTTIADWKTSRRFAAIILLLSYLVLSTSAALAQDFSDRSSEFISDLQNDSQVKAVELADFNNDGIEDLVISRHNSDPVLLLNENSVLVNRTGDFLTNAAEASNSNYAEAFDANADGLTDIVFGRLDRSPLLYINRGIDASGNWAGFDNGTPLAGANNILVIESGDVTGDGAPDLFIIQVEMGTNRLLVNDGNGNFTEESSRLGPLAGSTHLRGHAARLEDVENDGDIDIVYIESDLRLYIYYNIGDGNFTSPMRSVFSNPDNFAYTFGAADFNGDGIFDYRQYSNPAPNAEMSTGTFDTRGRPEYTIRTDAPMLRGNRKHGFVHMRDFDGDGDTDYVLSSIMRNFGGLFNSREGHRTEMVINQGVNSGTFRTFVADAWASEESYDMKMIDVNGDGNLDMFIAHDNRYAVYVNGAPPAELSIASFQAPASPAGVDATYSVELQGNPEATFDWDFGDGSPPVSTNSASTTHQYVEPGRYQIVVTATANNGSTTQTVMTARVHDPLEVGSPQVSMSITYQSRSDDDRVYVVNPDHDSITAINAITGEVLAEISVGDEPRSVSSDDFGRLYVVNRSDATLTRVDTETLSVFDTIELARGSRPSAIVTTSDGQFAYIALSASAKIIKLNLTSGQIEAELNSGPNPRELGLSADGLSLYAPRFISLPTPDESTRSPANGGGEVLIIETGSMTVSRSIEIPYNNPVDGVDTGIESRGIPNYLRAPAISPSGLQAFVPAKLDNIYRGSMRDGNAREHDMLVRGILSELSLDEFREVSESRIQFDNLSPPVAAAYGPTGNFVFTAHEGSRVVKVLDAFSGNIITSTDVGFAPLGIIASPDGAQVFVHNYLSRNVSFLNTSGLMDGSYNTADVTRTIGTVTNEKLSEQVLLGKRLFHDSKDTRMASQEYISCAVCHDDAGGDGRVWDFSDAGEGLRNTTDLRSRAEMDHGNVHWSANFNEIQDFENDIREIFDGIGLLDNVDFNDAYGPLDEQNPKSGLDADLDAIAAYFSTLTNEPQSPLRSSNGALTSAGERGKSVFQQANCALCHSGTRFTDSPTSVGHDIGTVDADTGGRLGQPLLDGGLDTPTLRGLWMGAPYLHDGSAPTVQAAVQAHDKNMNTDLSLLSEADVDDLASYLLQIDESEIAASSTTDQDGDGIIDSIDPDDNNDGEDDSGDTPSNPSPSIRIDSDFTDWAAASSYAADPDDISGADNPLDLDQLWLAHDDDTLYIRYDSHAPDDVQLTWGYSVQMDTDSNPATGFRGFQNELPVGVDYMIEGNALHRYTGTGNDFSWGPGFLLASGLDATKLELAIPRTALGNPPGFRLFMFANNSSVNGSAVDYYPDDVTNADAALETRSFAYRFGDQSVTPTDPPQESSPTTYYNPATIALDGNLNEWSSLASFGPDPDDASGINTIDWREAWMAHDADNFYLAWRNDTAAVLSWGNGILLDTDQNSNSGFVGFSGEFSLGVDFLLEANTVHRYTGTGNNWSWETVGSFEPVIVGDNVEARLPRTLIGNPENMYLFFSGQNSAIGGDTVDFYPDAAGNTFARADTRRFAYSTLEQVAPPAAALSIVIDGNLADWQSGTPLGVDDADDIASPATIDWMSLRAQLAGDALYVAYETYEPIELSWGHSVLVDADQNTATGFSGFSNELAIGADFIIEGRQLQRFSGQTQSEWSWEDVSEVEVVVNGTAAELKIDLALLNDAEAVDLILRGENAAVNEMGIDYVPDSGKLTLSDSGPELSAALPEAIRVGASGPLLLLLLSTFPFLFGYNRNSGVSRLARLLRLSDKAHRGDSW